MREIKFRAWDKATRKILEVIEIDFQGMEILVIDHEEQEAREAVHGHYELMQFIGLKDKNGTEIYEGDIIKGKAIKKEGEFDYFGVVEIVTQSNVHGVLLQEPMYDEDFSGGWRIDQLQARISLNNITGEIIGNIYENPELLESKS